MRHVLADDEGGEWLVTKQVIEGIVGKVNGFKYRSGTMTVLGPRRTS